MYLRVQLPYQIGYEPGRGRVESRTLRADSGYGARASVDARCALQQPRQLVRQRARRDNHRSLQDRGDRKREPWRTLDEVENATLEWVDWFNHRRLLESIDNVLPAELELAYHRQQEESAMAA